LWGRDCFSGEVVKGKESRKANDVDSGNVDSAGNGIIDRYDIGWGSKGNGKGRYKCELIFLKLHKYKKQHT
jgi:hypothetical protein